MTVDKLIERLEWLKDQVGGECEVKVMDGRGVWEMRDVASLPHEDPTSETGYGCTVYVDVSDKPA